MQRPYKNFNVDKEDYEITEMVLNPIANDTDDKAVASRYP